MNCAGCEGKECSSGKDCAPALPDTKHSQAPVTTLVVKDRVLAHNPAGALYSAYYWSV